MSFNCQKSYRKIEKNRARIIRKKWNINSNFKQSKKEFSQVTNYIKFRF